jgi:hypothetical protein
MRSCRHVLEVDRVDLLAISYRTVASIVSKTILDTYDNPASDCQFLSNSEIDLSDEC